MKFSTVLILILHGWCLKITSAENMTKTYYAVLEIENSTYQHFTDFLGRLAVNTNGNAIIKNATVTKDCILNNNHFECKCGEQSILSSEFVKEHNCSSNEKCNIPPNITNMSCRSADRVIINGTLTTTDLDIIHMFDAADASINEHLATRLIYVFSTFDWFGDLEVSNVREGSVKADFGLLINAPITSSELKKNIYQLQKDLTATIEVVITGFITITTNDSIIKYDASVNTTCTSPEDNLGNVTWYLLRNGKKIGITNGQQSSIYTNSRGSTLIISNIAENWKGTIICEFVNTTVPITYKASGELDIALLPTIFAISYPQFPDCRNTSNKGVPPVVNFKCIIDNSTEKYTVNWTDGGLLLGPKKFAEGRNKIYYQATKSINCTTVNETVNVKCIFTNRKNQIAERTLQIKIIKNNNTVCPAISDDWPDAKANSIAIRFCKSDDVGIMERICTDSGSYGVINDKCVSGKVDDLLTNAMNLQNGIGFVNKSGNIMFESLRIFTESQKVESFANINASVTVMFLMFDASKIQNTTMNDTFTNIVKSSSNLLNDSLLKSWQAHGDQQNTTVTLATTFLTSLEGALNHTNITEKYDNAEEKNVHTSTCIKNALSPNEVCNRTFNVTIRSTSFDITAQSGIKNINRILPKKLNDAEIVPNEILLLVIPTNTSNKSNQKDSITIEFSVNRPKNVKMFCVYLDNDIWSKEGCKWGGAKDPGVCICDHLSSFTILMAKTPMTVPFLENLTYIGLGFSICSLALGLVIEFLVWNSVVKSNISHFKHTALVNIMLSLLIAHCCFLTSATPNPPEQWCLAFTVMKHFCFLAVFCWMLCLSMGILHQMVFIFIHLRKKVYLGLCFSVGYILPFLIVIVTIITYNNGAPDEYYDRENCWLRYDRMLEGSIHAFVLPVGVIVFVNMFTMVLVICTILKPTISEGKTQDEKDIVRSIIKSVVMLTPSLGITWIFGLLMMAIDLTEEPLGYIMNYSFTFFNSFQGLFILLTGCFGEKKVRDELIKRFRKQKETKMRNESIIKPAFKRK